MSKEHYFVVVGELNLDGIIDWSIATEYSVSPEGPEYSIWNNDDQEWERVIDNAPEDNVMFNELKNILSKDYDLGPVDY